MPELWLDPDVDALLTELGSDPTRAALLARLDDVLDSLADDPGRAELRRHRFQIGVWGVVVRADDEEWVVLWEPHPSIDDAVIVQYVGPASFT